MTRRIEDEDFSGVRFKNVNFAGAKIVEGNFAGANINGFIAGLKVNGIEVGPLIHQEQERRHPERKRLFATDPRGFNDALSVLEAQLDQTWARARNLTQEELHQQVDEEWSTLETVRHIVFVIDSWVGQNILEESDPYHPIGLPPSVS